MNLSGIEPNSESIPAIAPTSLREAIFDGHGPLRGRLHPAATSTPVFPFPYAYHRRRNRSKQMAINKKQKQKKATRRKIRTSSIVLKRIKKTKIMLVHLSLLYKNLNKNFETGIEDISKINVQAFKQRLFDSIENNKTYCK